MPLIMLNQVASSLSSLPTRKMGSLPRVQMASESEGSLVTISTPALSLLTVISWDPAGSAAPARARARPAATVVVGRHADRGCVSATAAVRREHVTSCPHGRTIGPIHNTHRTPPRTAPANVGTRVRTL